MAKYKLTSKAEEDFDSIALYSLEHWGLLAAEDYMRELDEGFERLASDQFLGRDRSDIQQRLLSYPCNSHMIFFRRDIDGNVEILRILGQSMDFERHI